MIKKEVKPVTKTSTTSSASKPIPTQTKNVVKASDTSKTPAKTTVSTKTTVPAKTVSSTVSAHSTKPTIVQSKNIQQVEQKPKENKIQFILLKIQKSNEQETKLKELIELLKKKSDQVELELDTKFENDNQLLNFSTALIKVASQIKYVKWKIQGAFTDDGQAKCIGDIVSRFTSAYRINLKILDTYFADKGAFSLANAIKRLVNTHVFKFKFQRQYGKIAKHLTEEGQNKINEAIMQMPKLEIFKNSLQDRECKTIAKNQANLEYSMAYHYDREITDDFQGGFKDFKELVQLYGNRITSINFLNYSCERDVSKYMSFQYEDGQTGEIEKFFYHQIQFVFDLPYLTKFKTSFNGREMKGHNPSSRLVDQIQFYNHILNALTQDRLITIYSILGFKQNMLNFMVVNPQLILTDLWID